MNMYSTQTQNAAENHPLFSLSLFPLLIWFPVAKMKEVLYCIQLK